MQQRIDIHFPQNILTIKQAIAFILQFSGYHLTAQKMMSQPVQAMLSQPLPEVNKNLGPMSLKQSLMTLAGSPFYLLVDPVHRLVSFQLRPRYINLYLAPHSLNKSKVLSKGGKIWH